MQKEAIIIGHNFNSILGLARALGPEGYTISVIRTGRGRGNRLKSIGTAPEEKSKYVNAYCIADSAKPEALISLLINRFSSSTNKPVLFPVDDIAAEIIDNNYDRLKVRFFAPNVDDTQGGVIQLMDKHYQKQLAKRAGLPVPEGWSVKVTEGKYELSEEITYPCFVKPETPILNRKKYMGRCNSKAELRKILDSVASYQDCLMLVEEYVEIEKEYGSVGVCNRDKVCVPGITEKTRLGHGSHAGVTACGKIHLPAEYKEICEKLRSMMAMTGLQGLFDIDLYESKGVMYFNELNVRLGAEGVGTLIAGVNLALMSAQSFLEPEKENDYDVEAREITFANEKPLSSDYGEGYITWKEYKKAINSVDYRFIYSESDRGPLYNYRFNIIRQFLRRIKKKCRGFLG